MLESGDAPNLKSSLKNIIRAAITNTEGNDGYQKFLTDRAVSSRLNIICLSLTNFLPRDLDCLDMIWTFSTTMFKGRAQKSWSLHFETVKPLTQDY